METVRLYNWDQITSTNHFIPQTFSATYQPIVDTNHPGVVYSGTMIITTNVGLSANYSGKMRKITISLDWKTGDLQRNRTLTTYVTENGLYSYIEPQNYH